MTNGWTRLPICVDCFGKEKTPVKKGGPQDNLQAWKSELPDNLGQAKTTSRGWEPPEDQ